MFLLCSHAGSHLFYWPRARSVYAAWGGGREIGSGMLGNPHSLPLCPGFFPLTSYIKDSPGHLQPHVIPGTQARSLSMQRRVCAPRRETRARQCVQPTADAEHAACTGGLLVPAGSWRNSIPGRPGWPACPRWGVWSGQHSPHPFVGSTGRAPTLEHTHHPQTTVLRKVTINSS